MLTMMVHSLCERFMTLHSIAMEHEIQSRQAWISTSHSISGTEATHIVTLWHCDRRHILWTFIMPHIAWS